MERQTDLIVGDGRMAFHLKSLYERTSIPFEQWTRAESSLENLKRLAEQSRFILLAVPDRAIREMVAVLGESVEVRIVHFSGLTYLPHILGLHPIAAFGNVLYPLDFYKNLNWTTDQKRTQWPPFIFKSPLFIEPSNKPLYHALLSMCSNLPQLLALIAQRQFSQWNWPLGTLDSLIESTSRLMKENHSEMPTGPIFRGDHSTVEAHLDALYESDLFDVYREFKALAEKFMKQSEKGDQ